MLTKEEIGLDLYSKRVTREDDQMTRLQTFFACMRCASAFLLHEDARSLALSAPMWPAWSERVTTSPALVLHKIKEVRVRTKREGHI